MAVRTIPRNRIQLRAVGDEDATAIDGWYGEAARAAYEERPLEELRRLPAEKEGALLAIARPDRDEPIGLLEYEVREGWLTIPFIALAKAYRGWGYGSEAVRLVEEWAVSEGLAGRFRAEVDVRKGLGLYFWLRLGYRPVGWYAEGGRDSMAMVREASG